MDDSGAESRRGKDNGRRSEVEFQQVAADSETFNKRDMKKITYLYTSMDAQLNREGEGGKSLRKQKHTPEHIAFLDLITADN